MNEIKNKLLALEAKVDAKLFSVMRGPDGKYYREDGTLADRVDDFKTVGGAVATAGAVGGGLVADRAIMNRYGGGGSGMAVRKSAYRSAGRDLMESGRAMGGRAIDAGNDGFRAGQRSWRATKPGAFGRGAMRVGVTSSTSMFTKPTKPGGLLYRLRKAIGTGLGVATGGKIRFEDQVKARIEFMIPALVPMLAGSAAKKVGSAALGRAFMPGSRGMLRELPGMLQKMPVGRRAPLLRAAGGALGAATGAMRGTMAGAAIGGIGGAVKGALDENTSVLGGAFKGALGGGALGGVAGAGVGGAAGVGMANRLMRSRSMRGVSFAAIKERLVELASPLGEFNQTYRQQQTSAKAAARDARLAFRKAKANYKHYRDGVPDDAIVDAAREKLVRESHIMRGAGVGALAGGASAGLALRRGGLAGAAFLAPATAIIGAGVGAQIGGRIRKKKSQ